MVDVLIVKISLLEKNIMENLDTVQLTQENEVLLGNDIKANFRVIEALSIRVYEGKKYNDNKKRMVVKLIEAGESKNGYFYSKEVAESISSHIKERNQMYMDHSMWGGGRSFKDLVAVATESYSKDGASYAIVEMVDNPQTNWIYNLAKNFPGTVGASIDARAKVDEVEEGDPGYEEGKQKYIVKEIVFLNSVDFVTYPAAGGYVTELLASRATDGALEKFNHVMENFNQEVANLINDQNTEVIQMSDTKKADKAFSKETLMVDYPEIYNSIKEEAISDSAKDSETTALIEGLRGEGSGLKDQLEDALKERDSLKTKLDEFETKEKVTSKRKAVMEAIANSGLDKAYISDVFIDDLMKLEEDDDIQVRLQDRKTLVEATQGDITDNGERAPESAKEKKEEQVEEASAPTWDASSLVNSVRNYKQLN
jgi:hypothetical protein